MSLGSAFYQFQPSITTLSSFVPYGIISTNWPPGYWPCFSGLVITMTSVSFPVVMSFALTHPRKTNLLCSVFLPNEAKHRTIEREIYCSTSNPNPVSLMIWIKETIIFLMMTMRTYYTNHPCYINITIPYSLLAENSFIFGLNYKAKQLFKF